MDRDKYNEIINNIEKGWPSDRFMREKPTRTILTCENGTFIRVSLMELPEELLGTSSQMDEMHNKLLIQWTDDLSKRYFKNLARYIAEDVAEDVAEDPPDGPMLEALTELSFRLQLSSFL